MLQGIGHRLMRNCNILFGFLRVNLSWLCFLVLLSNFNDSPFNLPPSFSSGVKNMLVDHTLSCVKHSVANCPVFNRTVRYFGDLSGLKMKAKPDMHAFVRYINPVILAHAPWFTVAGMRCPVFLNVLSGNPSKACTLYRV